MTWFLGISAGFLMVAVLILWGRLALLSSDLHYLLKQAERLQENFRAAIVTLRLDIGLRPSSMYCGLCLQWTGGDPRKHADYCRFSYASWVRNYKVQHPGEPLPEGAEDPDEQQQQGHRPVPENPA